MRYSTTLAAIAALLASPVVNADGLYSKGSSVLSLDQKGFKKLEKSYLPSVSSDPKTLDSVQLTVSLDSRVRNPLHPTQPIAYAQQILRSLVRALQEPQACLREGC